MCPKYYWIFSNNYTLVLNMAVFPPHIIEFFLFFWICAKHKLEQSQITEFNEDDNDSNWMAYVTDSDCILYSSNVFLHFTQEGGLTVRRRTMFISVFEIIGKSHYCGQKRTQRLRCAILWHNVTWILQYFWISENF